MKGIQDYRLPPTTSPLTILAPLFDYFVLFYTLKMSKWPFRPLSTSWRWRFSSSRSWQGWSFRQTQSTLKTHASNSCRVLCYEIRQQAHSLNLLPFVSSLVPSTGRAILHYNYVRRNCVSFKCRTQTCKTPYFGPCMDGLDELSAEIVENKSTVVVKLSCYRLWTASATA